MSQLLRDERVDVCDSGSQDGCGLAVEVVEVVLELAAEFVHLQAETVEHLAEGTGGVDVADHHDAATTVIKGDYIDHLEILAL